jgi:hypothetical protein
MWTAGPSKYFNNGHALMRTILSLEPYMNKRAFFQASE